MGAINFDCLAYGMTIQEAYNNAIEEATDEHGNDTYNGTINTTSGYKDVTEMYLKSGKKLHEFIASILDASSKYACYGVCVEKPKPNTNKVKSVVVNHPVKGTRKWETYYYAKTYGDTILLEDTSQTKCIKRVREYVEKHPNANFKVCIGKRLVGRDNVVAQVSYKKSNNEKLGKWLFFGIASY